MCIIIYGDSKNFNSKVLERLLFSYGVEDIKQVNIDKQNGIKIFLNEVINIRIILFCYKFIR